MCETCFTRNHGFYEKIIRADERYGKRDMISNVSESRISIQLLFTAASSKALL